MEIFKDNILFSNDFLNADNIVNGGGNYYNGIFGDTLNGNYIQQGITKIQFNTQFLLG